MAFLAVFVALKIAHRAGGYAGWAWFPTICDLRCPEHHLVQLKNPLQRISKKNRSHIVGNYDHTASPPALCAIFRATKTAKNAILGL